MPRRKTQILGLCLVLVFAVAAAGCGGGKKNAATTTETTASTAATTTTTESTTTSGSTTTSSDLGSVASVENCKQLSDLGAAFSQAMQGANGDVQKEAALLQQFAAKTPSDIRPDFETMANALSQIAGELKGVDLSSGKTPDAATIAKIAKLGQQFSGAKFTLALQHIQAWAAKNCGTGG